MPGKCTLPAALLVAAVMLYPLMARTNSGGAQPSRTGAPLPDGGFEATCAASGCHDSFALNSGPGALVIEAPDQYTPGAALDMTLRVTQAGPLSFGFEVAVKDAGHEHVGTLELVDASTTRFASPTSSDYVTHGSGGIFQNEWTVRWVAPEAGVGDVTIYAAGNAGDLSGNREGDYVYTASKTLSPGAATGVEEAPAPPAFTLDRAYPNPFSVQTLIGYRLRQAAPVTLVLYDALGRQVRVLALGTQAAGPHQVRLYADGLTAGLYLYELRTPTAREARPLLLIP